MPEQPNFFLILAGSLCQAWVRLYTAAVPDREKTRRVEEVKSDLWEQSHQPTTRPTSTAVHILLRLIRGIPADLIWSATASAGQPRSGVREGGLPRQVFRLLTPVYVVFVMIVVVFNLPVHQTAIELHVLKGSGAAIISLTVGSRLMQKNLGVGLLVGVPGLLWLPRILEYVLATT